MSVTPNADRMIEQRLTENWWGPTVTFAPYRYQGGFSLLAPDDRIQDGDIVWVIKGRERVDPRGLYVATESVRHGPINVLKKELKKAGKPVTLRVEMGGSAASEIKRALDAVRSYIK